MIKLHHLYIAICLYSGPNCKNFTKKICVSFPFWSTHWTKHFTSFISLNSQTNIMRWVILCFYFTVKNLCLQRFSDLLKVIKTFLSLCNFSFSFSMCLNFSPLLFAVLLALCFFFLDCLLKSLLFSSLLILLLAVLIHVVSVSGWYDQETEE